MIVQILKKCPLFEGIDTGEIGLLLNCLRAVRRNCLKDEFIFRAGDKASHVGIVLAGGVYVIQEDYWGNRNILAHVAHGGLFAEAFSCAQTGELPISVTAAEKSEIMLVDYRKIITLCPTSCAFHSRLISNMVRILAKKNILLTQKLDYLSKRTIRGKLLAYLSAETVRNKKGVAEIPFNRQELADYLCVERSALSRELGQMKKEGIIGYNRNTFTLSRDYKPD